ncbi:hypothetical protein COV18_01140 [Candidatus Woesearchaeota archaeon CG10_big_fil_rev_8_21_14_0_10_37_12]|nr:MAG: hypothetical protein COV18_01140 [Candidatus Woesearchaeota archaeon CG10_big_fil_rev_8_21_14_0_10_37_12]
MAERFIAVGKNKVVYKGLFSTKEFYGVYKQWLSDKGYNPVEKSHVESVTADGKFVELKNEPFKKFSDYVKSIIRFYVQFNDLKDVVVERDGKKVKLQEGEVVMTFEGLLETDYEHHWEMKPLYYVLRTTFEKYVYTPYISGFQQKLLDDLNVLKHNVDAYLNLEKYGKR